VADGEADDRPEHLPQTPGENLLQLCIHQPNKKLFNSIVRTVFSNRQLLLVEFDLRLGEMRKFRRAPRPQSFQVYPQVAGTIRGRFNCGREVAGRGVK